MNTAKFSGRIRPCLIPLLALPSLSMADHVEEILVSARHDTRTIDVTEALIASPDVTELLR